MNRPGAIIIEGHVQGLSNTRSLGEAGVPVFVVDRHNCIARYSKYCKKFFKCPDYIDDKFADFLIGIAEKEKIKGWTLVPSNDHAVITISRHKSRLASYYKIVTPDIKIIESIYNKYGLLFFAEKNGISIPKTYTINDNSNFFNLNGLNYPLIIKGRFGLSFYKKTGKKAFLVENERQFKDYIDRIIQKNELDNSFIQELIPSDGTNKTVSFTAFCEAGEIKTFWMGVKLREHPLQFGTATFAESVFIEECKNNSAHLLKALNYSGVCEIEYLKDPRDGKYKLIEINARTWLWVGLAKECGIDYARYIYDYLNDNSVTYPQKYSLGTKWINYLTDTLFSIKAIIKGKLGLKEYLKSFSGEKIPAVFKKDDIIPGIMFLLLLPSIYSHRT